MTLSIAFRSRVFVVAALAALVAALMTMAPRDAGAFSIDAGLPELHPAVASDLATLPGTDFYSVFVSFEEGSNFDAGRATVEATGLHVVREYRDVDALFAIGTVAQAQALAVTPGLVYIDTDREIELLDDTAPWATRVRVAQEPVAGGPYYDAAGNVLDGSGVGVAIVDSGIDASHPDLIDRVARNFKGICTTPALINPASGRCFGNWLLDELADGEPMKTTYEFQELPPGSSSDTTSGHGTHVAGIVAGTGAASTGEYPDHAEPNIDGTITGVAPGATLYGFGVGEGLHVFMTVEAFSYILDHYEEFNPRIRVINNSWGDGAGSPYNPDSVSSRLVRELVARGTTVAFAAGNSGGDGSADRLSSYAKDPTPGVISVANYNDANTGTRDGSLSSSSSRGLSTDGDGNPLPDGYPDISAPGTLIHSACAPGTVVCPVPLPIVPSWPPYYTWASGTSMAAPHVAGGAALLLQARPDLTPAQVEDVLQDTAYKFTAGGAYVSDSQNTDATTSFDKGAGLLDAKAALDSLGVAHGKQDPLVDFVVVDGDGGDTGDAPGALDIVGVSVSEDATGKEPALRYNLTIRNAEDFGALPEVSYRLYQFVDGTEYRINVFSGPGGLRAGSATPTGATATALTRTDNVISFVVPLSVLGLTPDDPVFGVYVFSYATVLIDAAPGPEIGIVAANLKPMVGRPFTVPTKRNSSSFSPPHAF